MRTALTLLLLAGWLGAGSCPAQESNSSSAPAPDFSVSDSPPQPAPRPAPPPGKKVYTLRDCLERVASENPAVRAIQFNLEAMDRRAKSVRALYLPQITAAAQAGGVNGEPVGYFSVLGINDVNQGNQRIAGVREYQSGSGELYMPLIEDGSYFGINTPPAETVQLMNKEITRYTGDLTLQQMLFNVTKTYLEVIESKHKLDLLARQKILSDEKLRIEQTSYQYDLATQAELSSAELAAAQNASAYDAAANLATESFLRMALMLQIDDPRTFSIELAYPPMPKLPSYPSLVAMIRDDHPALMKQQAVVKQAQAQLALDQNKIWPTVAFRSNYTYADSLLNGGEHQWTTFVTVNVPVFDFGILHNQTRADLAAVQAQYLQMQQSRDDLQQGLYDAYIAIRDNTYAAAAINSQVATARQALEKMQVLQQADSVAMQQAISVEQDFLNLRLSQEDITVQHMLSYASLQSVVAGRWNWLNPTPAISERIDDAAFQNPKSPPAP